ncbi:MAG: TolB family protein, partial [Thiobacillaceae bacterium]
GGQANGDSGEPALSADGRWLAYTSAATNLVAGDDNGANDVFLYDRNSDQTMLVSRAAGRHGTAGAASVWPSVSADGRWVAFLSAAGDLVVGGWAAFPALAQVYLYDRQMGRARLVSADAAGKPANRACYRGSISADGRWLAFTSAANNLVGGLSSNDDWDDVFVYGQETRRSELLTMSSDGEPGDGVSSGASLSADGRWLAFISFAKNLVAGSPERWLCLYVADRRAGTIMRVAKVTAQVHGSTLDGGFCAISADAHYVAFASTADDLVPDDTNCQQDIFIYDCWTEVIRRVSVSSRGDQGNGWSGQPSISADGRFIAYSSRADNLVAGDTNGQADVFVYDMQTGRTERISVASR